MPGMRGQYTPEYPVRRFFLLTGAYLNPETGILTKWWKIMIKRSFTAFYKNIEKEGLVL
jgi:hypothetical protein